MLRSLKIDRFKTLRDEEIAFGAVNLFIGGNGTGKSNVLEAIGLTAACLGRGLGDADIKERGVRVTPPELMKSSFKDDKLPRTLELMASFDHNMSYKAVLSSGVLDPLLKFETEACVQGSIKHFGRSPRGARATGVSHPDRLDKTKGIFGQIRVTYDIPEEVDNMLSMFSRFAIYAPQTDFLRGRQAGILNSPPIGLRGEGLPEAVRYFVDQYSRYSRSARGRNSSEAKKLAFEIVNTAINLVWLPGWAGQVNVDHLKPELTSRDLADRSGPMVYFIDQFMHTKRNSLSVYDSSEGTLFLLFAAILLAHEDAPKIFAIDNIDNGLNPAIARALVESIIKVTKLSAGSTVGAKQVFLTSHNPTALDAFDLFDDDQRIFVVKRNDRGHTKVTRLQPKKGMTRVDWETMSAGKNLSQLWLDGMIDGSMSRI